MKVESLVGKKFRRNKYGLSLWWDTISKVTVNHEVVRMGDASYRPRIWVKGSLHSIPIEEVVIIENEDNKQRHTAKK